MNITFWGNYFDKCAYHISYAVRVRLDFDLHALKHKLAMHLTRPLAWGLLSSFDGNGVRL
jgi:hypothetical protein